MDNYSFNINDFFVSFFFLSILSAGPVAFMFFIVKMSTPDSATFYSPRTLLLICTPCFLYGFLEAISSRQELNFFPIVLTLAITGIGTVFLIKKINMRIYLSTLCLLVVMLWWVVPKGMVELF